VGTVGQSGLALIFPPGTKYHVSIRQQFKVVGDGARANYQANYHPSPTTPHLPPTQDFLLRVDRYPRIDAHQPEQRIVLVEVQEGAWNSKLQRTHPFTLPTHQQDLPTYLQMEGEAADFHAMLQRLNAASLFPVVFVVSDEHFGSMSLSASQLFPRHMAGRLYSVIK
jgi:hypothetical protein